MRIGLITITEPTAEPVTLDEVKLWLRVDGPDFDDLITGLIGTAREMVQTGTYRQLMPATYALKLDCFPGKLWYGSGSGYGQPWGRERAWEHGHYFHDRAVILPRPPLQSVTSIVYVDASGATQTLDPSQYIVGSSIEPGRITPAVNCCWPDTAQRIEAVTITYVAGYASAAKVPASLKTAIKLLVSHWFANDSGVDAAGLKETPLAVQSLCMMNKVPWVW